MNPGELSFSLDENFHQKHEIKIKDRFRMSTAETNIEGLMNGIKVDLVDQAIKQILIDQFNAQKAMQGKLHQIIKNN